MFLVAVMLGAIWGVGRIMRAPRRVLWVLTAILLALVILIHLTLPIDAPLRLATGGSAAPWLILIACGALVWGYRVGLSKLRNLAVPVDVQPPQMGAFSDAELNRYSRHIVLREVGGTGQKALKNARVLVVGAGGLGAPALQYLAAAGVGTIGVIDDDVVEASNLQRQIIHRDCDIGTAKVFSAQAAMKAQNPFVTVQPYHRRLTAEIARDLFADYDLVLDGCDNFDTRYLVNETCAALKIPLISGALSQWEGQVSVFDPANGTPCYQCIFATAPAADLAPSCAEAGVMGPLPGIIGSIMAMEAIKVITGAGAALRGEMLIYDALYGESRKIALKRRTDCPVCGAKAG